MSGVRIERRLSREKSHDGRPMVELRAAPGGAWSAVHWWREADARAALECETCRARGAAICTHA